MSGDPLLVVVDASVAVKWFVSAEESGVEDAAGLLAQHAAGEIRLVAPTLIVHELMGVFMRRLRGPLVSEALDAFFDAGVHLVAPDRALMARAVDLANRCQLSAFDSAYAAVADSLECTLATADRRLANALAETLQTRII
jgi:predicted nucleic acid-binding protein